MPIFDKQLDPALVKHEEVLREVIFIVDCVSIFKLNLRGNLDYGPDKLIVIGYSEDLNGLYKATILSVEDFLPETGWQLIQEVLLIHFDEEVNEVVYHELADAVVQVII